MDISHEEPNYYEVCLESIQPFWISWEHVVWPWCNLAASQRKLYCACVNSHSPIGLVSQQWNTVGWARVGLKDLGDAVFWGGGTLHKNWRMGMHIVVLKLPVTICPQLRPFSSYCIPQPAKNFDAILSNYCLASRSVLMVEDSTFMIKKKPLTWPWLCSDFAVTYSDVEIQVTSTGKSGLLFQGLVTDPWLITSYDLLGEIWVSVRGFQLSPVQLQHEIPSALVTRATEQILLPHVSCHDPLSKSLK